MISLTVAKRIADTAVSTATQNGFKPICVYVLDASANVITSQRMDSCSPVGFPDFAKAKAYTCLALGVPSSRAFRDKYASNDSTPPAFCQMLSMVNITQGNMAPFPGGVLMKSPDGVVLGAVGVSGAAGDEDEMCALAGKAVYTEETGETLI